MQRALVVLAFLVLVALLSVDIYVRVQPPRWASVPVGAPPTPRAAYTTTAAPTAVPTVSATPASASPAAAGAGSPSATAAPSTAAPTARVSVVEDSGAPAPRPRVQPPARPAPAVTTADAAAKPPVVPSPKKPKPTRKPTPSGGGSEAATSGAAGTAPDRSFKSGQTTFELTTGETQVESAKSGPLPDVPAGFDPGGVAVHAAPKIPAKVEFEIQPKRLKAGEAYVVRVYLRNQGKKSIKVRELRVSSSLNGARSEAPLTPKMKEVPPQLSALLAEIPSVWPMGDVKAWSMEVAVRSGHGDVYKNSVSWR
jgi:hypothetical protein